MLGFSVKCDNSSDKKGKFFVYCQACCVFFVSLTGSNSVKDKNFTQNQPDQNVLAFQVGPLSISKYVYEGEKRTSSSYLAYQGATEPRIKSIP